MTTTTTERIVTPIRVMTWDEAMVEMDRIEAATEAKELAASVTDDAECEGCGEPTGNASGFCHCCEFENVTPGYGIGGGAQYN